MKRHAALPTFGMVVPGMVPFVPAPKGIKMPNIYGGLPLGITENGTPFRLNAGEWADAGFSNTPSIVVLGMQGFGKTALGKLIAYSMGCIRTRPNDPDAPFNRIWADDSKEHEWEPVARIFGCEPIKVGSKPINPLSPEMDLSTQEGVCDRIYGFENGQRLTLEARTAVRAGLFHLIEHGMPPSLHLLAEVLNKPGQIEPPLVHSETRERMEVVRSEFERECKSASRILSSILVRYGKVFGSRTDDSILKLFEQQFVSIDYSGVGEEIARLVQLLFWMEETNRNFNVLTFDEGWNSLKQPEFVVPLQGVIKRNRTNRRLVIIIAHALRDYKDLPEATRKEAMSIFKETPTWFVGRLEEPDAEDLQKHRRFSDKVKRQIVGLQKTEFMVFMNASSQPFKIRTIIPEGFLDKTFSNQALADQLGRSTH